MRRIGILAGALGAFAMASMGRVSGDLLSIDRERPVSIKRRRVAPVVRFNGRSKYMPHQSEKERERAARCYMQHYFRTYGPVRTDPLHRRSAPIVQVISKRAFYEQPF